MHNGSANAGHYFNYTKLGKKWYLCDDAVVQSIADEEMQAIAQQGYGANKEVLPVTFVYELSSARPRYEE